MKPILAPIPLNYGKTQPFWRRRWRSLLVTGTTLFVLAYLTQGIWQRWIHEGWRKSQELYWQRECMNYQAPKNKPAVDLDCTPHLQTSDVGPFSVTLQFARPLSPLMAIECLEKFELTDPDLFIQSQMGFFQNDNTPIFVHGLTGKSGHRYLVIAWFAMDTIWAEIIEPGKWNLAPVVNHFPAGVMINPLPTKTLRIYPGRLDPADPGHFTITYECDSNKFILDGHLDETTNPPSILLTTRPTSTW